MAKQSRPAKKLRQVDAAFYGRCRLHAARQGYGAEICEDFPSWAFIRKAEGASGTIAQLFVDYLRVTFGTKNSPNRGYRQALRMASGNSAQLEALPSPSSGHSPHADLLSLWQGSEGRERAIVGLYCWYGLTRAEIAHLFGISPTRVGQLLDQATAHLKAGAKPP